ncbi:MAG: polysaccharide biosynthesis protein [Campylobacterales bacterium]|nr:polysaccharide biosynthesis protein [Campylobacterales bacterium]
MLRPTAAKRIAFFVIADALLSLASLYGAYALRFNFSVPDEFLEPFWAVFSLLALLKTGFIALFRGYHIIWRFFGLSEAKALLLAHVSAYALFTLLFLLYEAPFNPFPRSVILIDLLLSMALLGLLRGSKRLLGAQHHRDAPPTLIIGMNAKSVALIKTAFEGAIPYHPIAIVLAPNESAEAQNSYLSGIKIYPFGALESLCIQARAAIITAELDTTALKSLYDTLSRHEITHIRKYKLLGGAREKLEELSIEELLARHPKDLDHSVVESFIRGKTVLITGAGGSIGSEIALQCAAFGAAKLILVESSEFNLYQIGERLPHAALKLLSITDRSKLAALMASEAIDVLIHAAAYKHVPLCEANITAAIENNIFGTKNVIDCAIEAGIPKVVIISTDKAVRPTNVMGATKRVAELYAQNVPPRQSEIVCVRFGNVLGSSGSVIPKFKAQIEAGGPVTVTHPEMTRYFMLISEACQLVLQAASIAKGGELFILDMGESIKIVDLAKTMIRLYGKEHEVKIVFSGLRSGEKLYEELLIDEQEKQTQFSSIFVAKKSAYDFDTLAQQIDTLLTCNDPIQQLGTIVTEFDHRP